MFLTGIYRIQRICATQFRIAFLAQNVTSHTNCNIINVLLLILCYTGQSCGASSKAHHISLKIRRYD